MNPTKRFSHASSEHPYDHYHHLRPHPLPLPRHRHHHPSAIDRVDADPEPPWSCWVW